MTRKAIRTVIAFSIASIGFWLVGTAFASPSAVPMARAPWLAPASSESAPPGASPDPLHAMEQTILELVNLDRDRNGLETLTTDHELSAAARLRAAAQVDAARLSHYDPDGRVAIANLLADASLQYSLAGENLVRLWGDTDEETAWRAHEALMLSPGHRANILEPGYNRVAIGAAVDGRGNVIFAEIFRSAPD